MKLFQLSKILQFGKHVTSRMMLRLWLILRRSPHTSRVRLFSTPKFPQHFSRPRRIPEFWRWKKETWIILLLLIFIWTIATKELLSTLFAKVVMLNVLLASVPPPVHFEAVPSNRKDWIVLPTEASISMPKRLIGKETTVKLPLGPIPDGAIHLIATSIGSALSPKARDLCSIESAALLHPDKVVVVSLQSDKLDVNRIIRGLSRSYTNIAFIKLDMEERLNGTILKDWYLRSNIANSKYATTTMSDIARIATLYKYGGYYADTDVIVLERFTNLRNTVPFDIFWVAVTNQFMVFDKGHPFLVDSMKRILKRYGSQVWKTEKGVIDVFEDNDFSTYVMMGPTALTDTIIEYGWCRRSWLIFINPASCRDGFTILPWHAFQAIPFAQFKPLLLVKDKTSTQDVVSRLLDHSAYGLHVCNSFNKMNRIILDPNKMITDILLKRCPVTCKMAGDEL